MQQDNLFLNYISFFLAIIILLCWDNISFCLPRYSAPEIFLATQGCLSEDANWLLDLCNLP